MSSLAAWAEQPNPDAEVSRAESLLVQGRPDEVIALLKDYESTSTKPRLAAILGKAYYRKRDLQSAIAQLRKALRLDSGDHESAQLLGLSYYSLGQFDLAIPPLESIRSLGRLKAFDSLYLLGICYLKTSHIEQARAAFAEMYAVTPDSPTAHLVFAQMMVRQRLEDRALQELQRALELDARIPMAHFYLGEIYLQKGEHSEALAEFQKELSISPTSWLVYWRTGDALARLERYDDAVCALKQAIWLNETFSGPYVLLGQITLRQGDLELALGFLERAVKIDPNNSHAHYLLAKAYQQAGHPDRAKQQFDAVRSLKEYENGVRPGAVPKDLPRQPQND